MKKIVHNDSGQQRLGRLAFEAGKSKDDESRPSRMDMRIDWLRGWRRAWMAAQKAPVANMGDEK